MLICKGCGFYGRIIPGTMQGIIILAVLPAFFANIEPENKTFKTLWGTDRYTLIEQSDVFTNCKWFKSLITFM